MILLLLAFSASNNAQHDSKWAWSSNDRTQAKDGRSQVNSRRGFERLEDFR